MTTTAATTKAAVFSFLSNLVKDPPFEQSATSRSFSPSKSLIEKDHVLIDMLNSQNHKDVSFCICDPDTSDTPIIFASEGFCHCTGYSFQEIEGRNCRFLQGPETAKGDVDRIRTALKQETEVNVNLLNYRKDGSTFVNQFFLAPLHSRDDESKVVYYIGVQTSVPKMGPGQMPANPGESISHIDLDVNLK
jgi:PAS domain S-box-containing protein